MSPVFPHLPADAWRSFLEDELDGAARERIEAHVDACPECRRILLSHDPSRAFRLLRVAPPEATWDGFWEQLEPALRERPRRRVSVLALAAAASVAGVAFLLLLSRDPPPPPDPCAVPEVAALKLTKAECEALFSGEIEAAEREVIVVRDLDLQGFGR